MSEPVAPAREAAFTVLRRVFEHGAYADRALRTPAAGLDGRDRALATQLVFGTVQRRDTLDHVLTALSDRPGRRPPPGALAALRLGLYQLLYLDSVPAHAAVGESVELVKRSVPRAAPFANAVLRRAARDGRALLGALSDGDPAAAAVLHSVPPWLAEMWWEELGPGPARALLAAINRPAEAALRVNTLRATAAEVQARLPVAAAPAGDLPEGLVLQGPFDAHGSDLFADGSVMPQSRASMVVARALTPAPGERVLDLCAAPGAKTSHLAALMEGEGAVVAVERNPRRASELRAVCERLGAAIVEVRIGDAAEPDPALGTFDRVLVDPPCSGLGTLQSRPDLRWRASPEAIEELAELQARILRAGADALAPGGTLAYSVCTISRREGAAIVDGLLAERPDLVAEPLAGHWPGAAVPGTPYLQLLPHRDGTDGFFIARLRRRGGVGGRTEAARGRRAPG